MRLSQTGPVKAGRPEDLLPPAVWNYVTEAKTDLLLNTSGTGMGEFAIQGEQKSDCAAHDHHLMTM